MIFMNAAEALEQNTVQNINSALAGNATSISTIGRWSAHFNGNDTNFEVKPRSLCPQLVVDFVVFDAVKEDPEINNHTPAMRLGCTHPSGPQLQKCADCMGPACLTR